MLGRRRARGRHRNDPGCWNTLWDNLSNFCSVQIHGNRFPRSVSLKKVMIFVAVMTFGSFAFGYQFGVWTLPSNQIKSNQIKSNQINPRETPPHDGLSVCSIVRVNREDPIDYLIALLSSMKAQSSPIHTQIFLIEAQSFVYDDDSAQNQIDLMQTDSFVVRRPDLKSIFESDMEAQELFAKDENILKTSVGYFSTDLALREIMEHNQQYNCDYVLFTNSDNLYHRDFFETTSEDMHEGTEMIGVTFTSHHKRPKKNLVLKGAGFYNSAVDLGAALVSTETIKRCDVRFMRGKTWFASDWWFFESMLEEPCKASHVFHDEVLFLHQ